MEDTPATASVPDQIRRPPLRPSALDPRTLHLADGGRAIQPTSVSSLVLDLRGHRCETGLKKPQLKGMKAAADNVPLAAGSGVDPAGMTECATPVIGNMQHSSRIAEGAGSPTSGHGPAPFRTAAAHGRVPGMTAPQTLPRLLPTPVAPLPRRRLRSLSPHLLLVANANASGIMRHPEVVAGASWMLRSAGARVETRLTSSLDELAALLPAAERRVVLLGGDGSVHGAANAPGAKPELAILPAGGANNVARSLGIPADLAAAARLAVTGASRAIDVIAARNATRTYLVVEGVSVGFHALARAEYQGTNSADLVAGLRAGVGALARFRPLAVGVEADGELRVMRIGQLFAANLPYFGPGLHVAPAADPADGLLDLVAIDVPGRASLVSLLSRLRRGTHVELPGVTRIRTRSLRIATGGRSPIIADTTNLGSGTVELTVLPAELEIVGAQR